MRGRERFVFSVFVAFSMLLSGCTSNGDNSHSEYVPPWDEGFSYIEDPGGHENNQTFNVTAPWEGNGDWKDQSWVNRTLLGNKEWAVF